MFSQFVSERDYHSRFRLAHWRCNRTSLPSVVRWQYWTLGLHERGFHNFLQVSAENNRNIRETFGNSQIDRMIPAVATFEVKRGFVPSRVGRNRERQTFADQL